MAGIKGRSGPPANMNNVRCPWRSYWKRRALRPADKWILKLVDRYETELIDDKGGEDAVSAGEARAVEIARVARTCWLLALSTFAESGILRGEVLHPAYREMGKFMSLELKALVALGLEKRQRPPMDLGQYLTQFKESAAGAANRAGSGDERVTT